MYLDILFVLWAISKVGSTFPIHDKTETKPIPYVSSSPHVEVISSGRHTLCVNNICSGQKEIQKWLNCAQNEIAESAGNTQHTCQHLYSNKIS